MPRTGRHSRPASSAPRGPRDRLSAGPEALFVYGSLRFPSVLRALLDREPETSPARVAGWRAVRLPDRPYPALVPSGDARDEVEGLLIERLEPTEWRVLDDFEDDVYELSPLPLIDGRTGWAYVCLDQADAMVEPWDYRAFAENSLMDYVRRCRDWRTNRP